MTKITIPVYVLTSANEHDAQDFDAGGVFDMMLAAPPVFGCLADAAAKADKEYREGMLEFGVSPAAPPLGWTRNDDEQTWHAASDDFGITWHISRRLVEVDL